MAEDSWLDTHEDLELDWLELDSEQVKAVVHAAVMDDSTPADRKALAPVDLPEREARLVQSLRRLKPLQRAYLRAYVAAGCTRASATRALNHRGFRLPDPSAVTRWFHKPDFMIALDLLKKVYLDAAGIDPASVLLKAGQVYDAAVTPQQLYRVGRDADGNPVSVPVGESVDLGNAMRAVEFMGKVNKMTSSDEGGTRVTLNIVNIADREARDVTP